jgi:hypothetical protein
LKNSDYKVKTSLDEARKNNEVISLSNSELIRQYHRVSGISFSYDKTRDLIKERNNLNKDKNNIKNRDKIKILNKAIDEYLFLENIIMIKFSNVSHYKKIIKDGLIVNNKRFTRLMCSAGNARKSVVLFGEESITNKLTEIFDNGRNKEEKLVYGKFTSYSGLFSSTVKHVSTPRFCIIDDFEFESERVVDWVYKDENKEDQVEERKMMVKHSPFDGQGGISVEFANVWSNELGLDYVPSAFVIRSAYLKGQVVTFDFKQFAIEKNVSEIKDVWGKSYLVKDLDAIITKSQFKLWQSYLSLEDYLSNCKKRGFGWGVSKHTPKKEKDFFLSTYQYLQPLELDNKDVEEICSPTISYLKDISSEDPIKTILYLMGQRREEDLKSGFFDNIDDNVLKALLINRKAIKDTYIKNILLKKLNKKIRDTYIGSLLVEGNYQTAISDMVAFCEFAFGLEVKGILKENEHYSHWWNERNVDTVVAVRSPLTFKSEVNLLHLKNDDLMKKWFSNNTSGIIYNVWGIDCFSQADSDYDGDLIGTTNNPQFIKGRSGGVPITYEKKTAPKSRIDNKELYKADFNSFGSRIGIITNFSTTLFSMISKYKEDSVEYKEILKRLKVCRKNQGGEIDKQKGILVEKISEWGRWEKITSSMTEEEKQKTELHNKLLLDKRPEWFQWLYPRKMKEIRKHDDIYENYCQARFGFSLDVLLEKERNKEEEIIFQKYIKYSPLIYNGMGTMDRISRYMRNSISEHKTIIKQNIFDYSIYLNTEIRKDRYKQDKMKEIFKEYNSFKKNLRFSNEFQNSEQMITLLRNKSEFLISNNISELANIAVQITYGEGKTNSFVWDLFSDGLFRNLLINSGGKIEIPVISENGNIEYLGKNYKMKGIRIDA